MTDKQINQRIAEACGWWGNCKENCMRPPNCTDMYCEIPNYCHDLNAMHEAEKVISKEQIDDYCDLLWPKGYGWFYAVHTTARERAEAFLRTLGKWDDQSGDATEMEVQK